MKILLLLFFSALAFAQDPQDPGCKNNCWMVYDQVCTTCHYLSGQPVNVCPDCRPDCWACPGYLEREKTPVPFGRIRDHQTLIGYIRELSGLPKGPVGDRRAFVDPRVHLRLMQAAVGKDSKEIGCGKAFKPETIQLLAPTIERTKLQVNKSVLARR